MATRVPAVAGKVINIGRAGENLATTVTFNVNDWIRDFGNSGFFSLYVQQGGGGYYPQNLVQSSAAELTNNIVEWEVTNSNTAIVGLGKCELVYAISGENDSSTIVKSIIYDIVVTNSLDIEAQGSVPSAIESWINEVSQMVEQINDAANQADKAERYAKGTSNGVAVASGTVGYNDNAKYYSDLAASNADKVGNMTTTTTTSSAGTNASVAITTVDNHYNLAFTIPRGNTGETGATGPAAGFGTPTASITNTVGTPSVNITTDGEDTAKIFNFAFSNLKGDKGDQGVGFAGTLTSLPTANASNYNIYKDKVYIYDGHTYSIIQSGSSYSWVDGGTITGLPSQTDNSGKYLTTNGTTASWATVEALPSQTNNSGKYLTTNGSVASWESLESVSTLTVDSAPIVNSTNLVTSGGVYSAISTIDALPSQSGNSGKYLTTNGTTASWSTIDALPIQTNNSGKYLTTNGTTASWSTIDALPIQTNNSGKYLTTNGTTASWSTIDALPSQTNNSGKYLTTNGTTASWSTIDALPSQTNNSGKYLTTNGTTASWATIDLSSKANVDSPTFTGTPAAPTATAGTNTTQVATTAFVNTALTNKITYGTSDLTAGTSSLANGVVYLVYE